MSENSGKRPSDFIKESVKGLMKTIESEDDLDARLEIDFEDFFALNFGDIPVRKCNKDCPIYDRCQMKDSIEYNGREHYDPWAVFHDDIFSFLRKVSSDMEKIKIAYEHGLRYVPISYDDVISKSTIERALKHYKSIEDVLSHYIRRYADCLKIPEKDLQIL